ncbi:hypothetical protein LCGC14_0506470 [marine sediment metagenome]|uniref:Uncharacterized protein n=1 Tax=marine sediment metagenome TaxID=412755 RepID=A0A0F9SKY8_9ZZZZ
MAIDNPKEEMFEISYIIHIERKEFPNDIIKLLKEHNIKFEIWKNRILKKEYDNSPEELSCVSLDPEINNKLKKLSKITGISIENIVSAELGDFLYSVGDQPLIFLDRHLGIENIEKPFEMLEKMNDIINIGESYLEQLKTQDLVKYTEKVVNPKET